MEHEALLVARIALYRRYLTEGADGDIALAYLWQIKRDEAALAVIAEGRNNERRQTGTTGGVLPMAGQRVPEDG
jgi:hypothetical protein